MKRTRIKKRIRARIEAGELEKLTIIKPTTQMPPSSNMYRRTWEQHFGVKIPDGYHIHHKDKNRWNNNPSNLLCLPLEEHLRLHEIKGDDAAVFMLKQSQR